MIRGLLVGGIVTIIASLFTHLPIAHPWIIIGAAILTAAVFSLGGLLNALFATKFDDISIVPTFVLTPLQYLGGVFYSISVLPPFWRRLTRADPMLYMIDTLRFGFLGTSDIGPGEGFGMMLGFLVILFAVSLWLLKRGSGLKS